MSNKQVTRIVVRPNSKLTKLPVYHAAEVFPMLGSTAMNALIADIKQNGQKEPVLVADNILIDGRNRLEACRRLDISVRVIDLGKVSDAEIGQHVISRNVHRRHLTTKQAADAALQCYELTKGEMTVEEVATLFGISRRSIVNARHRRDATHTSVPVATKSIPLSTVLADFKRKLSRVTEPRDTQLVETIQAQLQEWLSGQKTR